MRRLLLILPRLQQLDDTPYRLIKYSRFPPLSLLTIAGLTPADRWEIVIRDEHVESSEVGGDFDLVGIQTYISSSARLRVGGSLAGAAQRSCWEGCIPPACLTRRLRMPTPCASVRRNLSGGGFWAISSAGDCASSIAETAPDRRPWCRCRVETW